MCSLWDLPIECKKRESAEPSVYVSWLSHQLIKLSLWVELVFRFKHIALLDFFYSLKELFTTEAFAAIINHGHDVFYCITSGHLWRHQVLRSCLYHSNVINVYTVCCSSCLFKGVDLWYNVITFDMILNASNSLLKHNTSEIIRIFHCMCNE